MDRPDMWIRFGQGISEITNVDPDSCVHVSDVIDAVKVKTAQNFIGNITLHETETSEPLDPETRIQLLIEGKDLATHEFYARFRNTASIVSLHQLVYDIASFYALGSFRMKDSGSSSQSALSVHVASATKSGGSERPYFEEPSEDFAVGLLRRRNITSNR